MLLPGIGFTSASCSAYSIQNGVRLPGPVSPGSSQAGGIVTYTANLISPSGLACASDDPGPATMAATPRIMAEAKFCHPFINTGFPACARDADSRLLPALPRRMRFDRAEAVGRARRSGRHHGRFSCTSSSGADHGNGSIFISAGVRDARPDPARPEIIPDRREAHALVQDLLDIVPASRSRFSGSVSLSCFLYSSSRSG